jgi:hypothetical protein
MTYGQSFVIQFDQSSDIQFDREEMVIDEAELQHRELAEKLHAQQILQDQVK